MLSDDIAITPEGEKAIRQLSERHGPTMARLARLSRPLMRRFVSRVASSDGTHTVVQAAQEFTIVLRAEWELKGRPSQDLMVAFAAGLETIVGSYPADQRLVERIALTCDDPSVGPAVARQLALRLQLLFCTPSGTSLRGIGEEVFAAMAEAMARRPVSADFFAHAQIEEAMQAFAVLLYHATAGTDPERDLGAALLGLHPAATEQARSAAASMLAAVTGSGLPAPRR